ncbi:MAG: ATP-binding protein [Candidatus Promineifilaceae bacterium]
MAQNQSRLRTSLESILSFVVLILLVFLTFAKFVSTPYAGFLYTNTGQVAEIYVVPESNPGLQLDDQLIDVGSVSWKDFESNSWQTLFTDVQSGGEVPLLVQRGDQTLTIPWTFSGPTLLEALQRLNSQWWLPFVFWLAGMATLLLVRPKDSCQRLLVAFNFLTAVWLAAGAVAGHHTLGSIFIFKSAIWLSVPVYLHLHWLFPRPLGRLPTLLLRIGYLLAFILAALEWLYPSDTFYYLGFFFAVIGSVVLLFVHYIRQSEQRGLLRFLALAVGLAFTPFILTGIASLIGFSLPFFIQGGAALALPAIPGAYFYAIYKQHLGQLESQANRLISLYIRAVLAATLVIIALAMITSVFSIESTLGIGLTAAITAGIVAIIGFGPILSLAELVGAYNPAVYELGAVRFRANQLLTPFLFFVLLGTIAAILFITIGILLRSSGIRLLLDVIIAILIGLGAITTYGRLQRFVEHRILGIPLPPATLVEKYAALITTALSRERLIELLSNEVLPSLSIHQSALLNFAETPSGDLPVVVAYYTGVQKEQLPTDDEVSLLQSQAGQYRPPESEGALGSCPWIRLVLPLTLGDQTIGLWLLGRRDPDDLYSQSEIPVLQTLANQTAIALTNILQAEQLLNLYRANVGRNKAERVKLARTLHDEVLNQIAALLMHINDEATGPQFHAARQKLTADLRQIITQLRPPMFLYGLHGELEELVDDAGQRNDHNVTLRLNVDHSDSRYPSEVEENLFQIVRQAVDNALEHAQASTVSINGRLEPEHIFLQVEDDGVGFPSDLHSDLAKLVAKKHFGLAGMYERAQLVDAEFVIYTEPDRGTRIELTWPDGVQ